MTERMTEMELMAYQMNAKAELKGKFVTIQELFKGMEKLANKNKLDEAIIIAPGFEKKAVELGDQLRSMEQTIRDGKEAIAEQMREADKKNFHDEHGGPLPFDGVNSPDVDAKGSTELTPEIIDKRVESIFEHCLHQIEVVYSECKQPKTEAINKLAEKYPNVFESNEKGLFLTPLALDGFAYANDNKLVTHDEAWREWLEKQDNYTEPDPVVVIPIKAKTKTKK